MIMMIDESRPRWDYVIANENEHSDKRDDQNNTKKPWQVCVFANENDHNPHYDEQKSQKKPWQDCVIAACKNSQVQARRV